MGLEIDAVHLPLLETGGPEAEAEATWLYRRSWG